MASGRDFTKAIVESSYGRLRDHKKLTRAIIEAQLKHKMTFAYKFHDDPPMHIAAVDTEVNGVRYRQSARSPIFEPGVPSDEACVTFFQATVPLLLASIEEAKANHDQA